MLQHLHIQNYAIIDEIDIQFSSALNIITGETGAGKSIVMGALSLILGERADSNVLIDATKKCFIEGVFSIDKKQAVISFLFENELDNNNELIIRREIASNGKSRAFINDTPATLQQLKQLTSLLVDLHQQFDTLELGNDDFQREVIDALADNNILLAEYKQVYKQFIDCKKELQALQLQKQNFQKELDYNQFLFDELNELSLKENELEDLDAELKMLSNSEGIKTTLSKVYFDLKESEQPIVQTIKQLINQLQSYSSYHTNIKTIIERLQIANIELLDIAGEVETLNDDIVYDENRINIINDKISLGYKLLKKHNVQTTNELIAIQTELEQKLQAVLNIDTAILKKEKEVSALLKQANALAVSISNNRQKQSLPFAKQVNELLFKVGMPNAQLKVDVKECTLNQFGKDEISFLFDANKSNKFEPIRKVASGGELSRLMLCIKYLVAQKIDLPTLIFDEIDTGISGEAAKQVGIIMKQLSNNRQIICITHQPQIAAKASQHLFVYKNATSEKVKTNIKVLNNEERITAIAKMLSGENPTNTAIASAKEMML
ncbi:MAG: DNA repair protein RecN [Bacteroidetes bacterium]|nr:DNA repair protein RecN [Bacteroidota bacterium]